MIEYDDAGWMAYKYNKATLTQFLPKDSHPCQREISLKLIHLLMICYGTRQEEEEKAYFENFFSLSHATF